MKAGSSIFNVSVVLWNDTVHRGREQEHEVLLLFN